MQLLLNGKYWRIFLVRADALTFLFFLPREEVEFPPLPLEVKGKVFPYSLPSVGPGADPGVQAVSPQVT